MSLNSSVITHLWINTSWPLQSRPPAQPFQIPHLALVPQHTHLTCSQLNRYTSYRISISRTILCTENRPINPTFWLCIIIGISQEYLHNRSLAWGSLAGGEFAALGLFWAGRSLLRVRWFCMMCGYQGWLRCWWPWSGVRCKSVRKRSRLWRGLVYSDSERALWKRWRKAHLAAILLGLLLYFHYYSFVGIFAFILSNKGSCNLLIMNSWRSWAWTPGTQIPGPVKPLKVDSRWTRPHQHLQSSFQPAP